MCTAYAPANNSNLNIIGSVYILTLDNKRPSAIALAAVFTNIRCTQHIIRNHAFERRKLKEVVISLTLRAFFIRHYIDFNLKKVHTDCNIPFIRCNITVAHNSDIVTGGWNVWIPVQLDKFCILGSSIVKEKQHEVIIISILIIIRMRKSVDKVYGNSIAAVIQVMPLDDSQLQRWLFQRCRTQKAMSSSDNYICGNERATTPRTKFIFVLE
jgi:hypothetical protein